MPAKKTFNKELVNQDEYSHFSNLAAIQTASSFSSILRTPVSNQSSTEILVQFSNGVNAIGRAKAIAAVSGNALEVIWSESNDDTSAQLVRIKISGNLPTDKALEILSQQAGVKFVEKNFTVSNQATSNDPSFTKDSSTLWGMHGDLSGSRFGTGADEAWAAGYTGNTKTVVGVIDSGIDYSHPDLYLNIWLNQNEISSNLKSVLKDIDNDGLITFRDLNNSQNASYVTDFNLNGYIDAGDLLRDIRWENGIDEDASGYKDDLIGWDFVNNDNDPFDDNNHGTHVGGTIGGIGGNATGVVGVNWQTQMIGLKFLSSTGSGSISNAIRALDFYTNMSIQSSASSNFVGTNNSWGGGGFSQGMLDAINRTAVAGNLFIAAAGNSTTNNDTTASYPSNYSTLSSVGWDAVVAVASITNTGAMSSFSSYGNITVDLAAPGSSIMSTLPGGGYGLLSGTSMATPHVAGALALIASALPNASAQECLEILNQCVTYKAELANSLAWDGWLDIGKLVTLLANNNPNPNVTAVEFTDAALKIGEVTNIKITFSESVIGFDLSDISLSNNSAASLTNLTTSDNKAFNLQLTPFSNVELSNLTLSITGQSYSSTDGSRLGDGQVSPPFSIDTKAPSALISLSDSNLSSGERATVTFTFSEAVNGFSLSDISASNGSLSNLTSINTNTWSATFTPLSGIIMSSNTIQIAANSYTDSAGNFGSVANSSNYSIDTSANLIFGTDRSNTLTGTSSKDIINGVPANSSLLGRGSKDILTGLGGSDVFVLGAQGKVFYNDGRSNNLGTSDFAEIRDFLSGTDKLQLAQGNYVFNTTSINKVSGLGVYWDINANKQVDSADEMIGFLVGINSIDNSADLIFS